MATQSRTPGEYLGLYAEAWTEGDVNTILEATAPDYTFDDPNEAVPVTRERFVDYFVGLKGYVRLQRGTGRPLPFMALSEVVVEPREDNLAAWCWWSVPETDLHGAGFIMVTPTGVISERIAYRTKLV